MSLPLTIDLNFLPFFCKNNKFGCQEMLFKTAELFEHEYVCEFQLTYCADSLCKSEVNILNYLDHYNEKHGSHVDLGKGKTFKLPLLMDQIQSQTLQVILRNDLLTMRGSCQGTYQLANTVNGKPSWTNGDYAIWFLPSNGNWVIGLLNEIGQDLAYIYAGNDFSGLTAIENQWKSEWNPKTLL